MASVPTTNIDSRYRIGKNEYMLNVNLTRIVDALCALWATIASDLIGRAAEHPCFGRYRADVQNVIQLGLTAGT
jgi:hypothetical protein